MSRRDTIIGMRITHSVDNMHGRPCVRGLRVTVAAVLRTLATCDGNVDEVVRAYAKEEISRADILACISYGAMLASDDTIKRGQSV